MYGKYKAKSNDGMHGESLRLIGKSNSAAANV